MHIKSKPYNGKCNILHIVDSEEQANMFIRRLLDELQETYRIYTSINYDSLCLQTKYVCLTYVWSQNDIEHTKKRRRAIEERLACSKYGISIDRSRYDYIINTKMHYKKDAWKCPLSYILNEHGVDKVPELMRKKFTCPQPTETLESWLEKYCMEQFRDVDEKITKIAVERGVSYEEAVYIWKNAVDISSRAVGISFDKAVDIYLFGLANIIGNNE